MRWSARATVAASLALAATVACAGGETDSPGGAADGGGGAQGFGGSGGSSDPCGCTDGVHSSRIVLLSDDSELRSFDPSAETFLFLRDIPCAVDTPYSMAVDADGVAWILDAESRDLVTVALDGSGGCGDPHYDPGPLQAGFELFGMAFVARAPGDTCTDLFAHTYSGQGPFGEGPGEGALGVLSLETNRFEILASVGYDGGELTGTGAARLFAFAGVEPVKLVEYDRDTGATLATTPLDGFAKTNASAFSVFGSDVYFFTEAPPDDCDDCLNANCDAAYQACLADPTCEADLQCALDAGDFSDACGGSLDQDFQQCVGGTCVDECTPSPGNRVSRVSRLALGAPASTLETVVGAGPIRVVGAGTSICAPSVPQ